MKYIIYHISLNQLKYIHVAVQKPPRWCPWISTTESDLNSFSSARNRFCNHFSLKAQLKERLDEEKLKYRPRITQEKKV